MRFRYSFYFLLILIIFLRSYLSQNIYKNGDYLRITTKVLSEPLVFEKQQYLKIKGLKVYLPKYPTIKYGDEIVIEGQVNGGYLKYAKIVKISETNNIFFNFRNNLINFYKKNLPEPYSSLIAGITIGSRQMPEEFWERLRSTGTAHVVVASGTNITLLSTVLILSLTHVIKRKYAVFITSAVIVIYVVVSGFDAPIVRASLMGIILLFAQVTGRVADSWRVLVITSFLMLFAKPEWIVDLGFILSFVATASLLIFERKVSDLLSKIPKLFREGLSTSVAAQIGVSPIIFFTFGQFNLLSPVINALVIWTIPYIMILGMVSGIVGLIVPNLGQLFLFISFPLLWFFNRVVLLFS